MDDSSSSDGTLKGGMFGHCRHLAIAKPFPCWRASSMKISPGCLRTASGSPTPRMSPDEMKFTFRISLLPEANGRYPKKAPFFHAGDPTAGSCSIKHSTAKLLLQK